MTGPAGDQLVTLAFALAFSAGAFASVLIYCDHWYRQCTGRDQ